MTQKQHIETVKNLQAIQKKNDEKYEQVIKELKAKREPIRISFNWKASKVFWKFLIVIILAITSAIGNVWQFTIYRENLQTIRELENYSIIFRFAKARGGIYANEIDRVWQEFQESDTTKLMRDIFDIIRDFENGESVIRKIKNR